MRAGSRRSERSVVAAAIARMPGTPILLAVLLATACSNPLGPEQDELSAARARWAIVSANPYDFVQQRFCFCGPPTLRAIRTEVIGGVVNSAIYVDTGEPIDEPLSTVPTIDDLLDEIQDAIDRDAFSLDAVYDPQFGFPMDVSIDFDEMIFDEEMTFRVTDLRFLLITGS